jgi:hypothetical protein
MTREACKQHKTSSTIAAHAGIGVVAVFFVIAGRIIAWAMMGLGVLRVVMGFIVASTFEDAAAFEAASRRYLGGSTSGEAIDKGLLYIATGIAFGLLVRIATRDNHPSSSD